MGIIVKENGSSEVNNIDITYNGISEVKITPAPNYYISNIDCSDNYTVEDFNEKVANYGSQTIKIKNNNVDNQGTCTFEFKQGIYEFGYTRNERSLSVPINGNYKLETWGAQGGSSGGRGGYGAYAVGKTYLTVNDNLFINVGGAGAAYADQGSNESNWVTSAGGYNGGGNGYSSCGQGGGGGATHIATKSGVLSALSNDQDKILIVSSGGGGSYHWKYGNGNGNNGGGYLTTPYGNIYSYGGFGYGGVGRGNNCGGGEGGGGFTGGTGGSNTSSGGGGSSYIGNSLLYDKVMYCYGCSTSNEESTKTISTTSVSSSPVSNSSKMGNGYAKITLISID